MQETTTQNKDKIIQCSNLKFKLLYNQEEIDRTVQTMAEKIDATFKQIK